MLGGIYLFSETFKTEVDQVAATIAREDVVALKGYILSCGARGPQYVDPLLVIVGLFIVGVVVYAVVRRWRKEKLCLSLR